MSMYGIKESRVVRFILQKTGTYNRQYRRPYCTSLDGKTHSLLVEELANKRVINTTDVANSINFIGLSAQYEEEVQIPNGWEQERVRFLLEVRNEDHLGNYITEYIIGYTDMPGISMGGYVDPQMLFYINAINTSRTSVVTTPIGNQTHNNLIDSSHILLNQNHSGGFDKANNRYSIRPEDVYTTMDSSDYIAEAQEGDYILDTRNILARSPVRSKRDNNLGAYYTANILQSYFNNSFDSNGDVREIRRQASSQCSSDSTSRYSFMSYLRESLMSGSAMHNPNRQNNNFTLNDLQAFDPTWTQDRMIIVPITNDYIKSSLHAKEQSKPWHGTDLNTLWASTIVQSLPAIMLQCLINKIHVLITNTGMGGTPVTTINNVKTFNSGMDNTDNLMAFKNKLELQLMQSLSYGNQMSYFLEISCDLLGDTCISIQTNGEVEWDRFVCPSFSDGLMTPIVTQSESNVYGIAEDFNRLITDLGDIKGNPSVNHSPIYSQPTQMPSIEDTEQAYNLI